MNTVKQVENSIESRREPRTGLDIPVIITDLELQASFPGRMTDASPAGLGVSTARRARVGSAISVEWGETVILGEVIYSSANGPTHRTGIRVEEILETGELPDDA